MTTKRSVMAHGIATQKQFKPQTLPHKRRQRLEEMFYEEAGEIDADDFDNLLDEDWDL